jgi:hypothetical protein
MAEGKVVKNGCALMSAQRKRSSERGPDPEIGWVDAPLLLQRLAEKSLEENLTDVINCILVNIRAGHLPSVKLLVDLVATQVKSGVEVSAEAYESLAEVLWAAVQEAETENEG